METEKIAKEHRWAQSQSLWYMDSNIRLTKVEQHQLHVPLFWRWNQNFGHQHLHKNQEGKCLQALIWRKQEAAFLSLQDKTNRRQTATKQVQQTRQDSSKVLNRKKKPQTSQLNKKETLTFRRDYLNSNPEDPFIIQGKYQKFYFYIIYFLPDSCPLNGLWNLHFSDLEASSFDN